MIYTYKDYQIKPHKEVPTNYIIVTDGRGGKIPDCMQGIFTSTKVAKEQIDTYLEKKAVSNGKKAQSGD